MKVLLCTDGSNYSRISYEYAAWLGQRIDASFEILYVTDIRKQKAEADRDLSGNIGIDAYQSLLAKLVELEREKARINQQRAKIILEEAKNFLTEKGIEQVHLTHRTGFLVDNFHEFEQNADLIILGKRGETAAFAPEHLGANLERIVRASHRPCFVTSRSFQPIERVLLAYDGSVSCQKALQYLVDSSLFQGLKLHLINVAKHGQDTAQKLLDNAQETLVKADFNPDCQVLQGYKEKVIANYVEKHKINFLIMGAYGHSRIRHLVIGSTTTQMLRSCQIPVLLFK